MTLRSRRDLGSGLLPDRPGPARGSMGSLWDLAVRLQGWPLPSSARSPASSARSPQLTASAPAARLRTEDSDGHAELLLSTTTTQARWSASRVAVVLIGVLVLMVVAGVATTGLATPLSLDERSQFPRVLAVALAQATSSCRGSSVSAAR